jgi:predicted nucleic acid-binding protein
MSELVFIDTSVWILALRAGGPVAVRQEVEQLLATGRVATTPIVILELLTGARSSREFRELKEDLEALKQLELSLQCGSELISWDMICGERDSQSLQ